jgi:hypothetical protein
VAQCAVEMGFDSKNQTLYLVVDGEHDSHLGEFTKKRVEGSAHMCPL